VPPSAESPSRPNRGPAAGPGNRAALIAAAREVYGEDGLNAPFSAVAKRAGVGQGSLYRHFADRTSLAVAVTVIGYAPATAPLPEGDAGCKTSIAGDALMMLEQTENPDASWLWMEFLSRPETLARLTYETEGTLLPPLTSLLEGDEITEQKPVLQGFIDLMPCGVAPTASNPKFPRIETILNEQLGKAMYGEQTSDEALDNTAQEAEAILARGN
jgi:ABC-type glycerol-3-phosphate transport system substrate-binding protein